MSIDEKVVARIRKLLALSSSPNTNEAESALAKATALMQELGLSRDIVEVQEDHGLGPMSGEKVGAYYDQYDVDHAANPWQSSVIRLIALVYECEAIYMTGSQRSHIVGRESLVITTKLISQFLIEAIKGSAEGFYYKKERIVYVQSYIQGLKEQVKQILDERYKARNNGEDYGIVPVNEALREMHRLYPNRHSGKLNNEYADAQHMGYAHGRTAGLNPQVREGQARYIEGGR